jgi:hypothetical protein
MGEVEVKIALFRHSDNPAPLFGGIRMCRHTSLVAMKNTCRTKMLYLSLKPFHLPDGLTQG